VTHTQDDRLVRRFFLQCSSHPLTSLVLIHKSKPHHDEKSGLTFKSYQYVCMTLYIRNWILLHISPLILTWVGWGDVPKWWFPAGMFWDPWFPRWMVLEIQYPCMDTYLSICTNLNVLYNALLQGCINPVTLCHKGQFIQGSKNIQTRTHRFGTSRHPTLTNTCFVFNPGR